jgi:hypothetical protein
MAVSSGLVGDVSAAKPCCPAAQNSVGDNSNESHRQASCHAKACIRITQADIDLFR